MTFLINISTLMLYPKSLGFAMDVGKLAPGDNNDNLDDAEVEDGFNIFNDLAAYVDVDLALLQLQFWIK